MQKLWLAPNKEIMAKFTFYQHPKGLWFESHPMPKFASIAWIAFLEKIHLPPLFFFSIFNVPKWLFRIRLNIIRGTFREKKKSFFYVNKVSAELFTAAATFQLPTCSVSLVAIQSTNPWWATKMSKGTKVHSLISPLQPVLIAQGFKRSRCTCSGGTVRGLERGD